ncbi:ribonuclease H-like domain-containing protein [Terfezia claveryi]|nr:ribonuclease H-like domain-containing protein [Terfezia claveryi]
MFITIGDDSLLISCDGLCVGNGTARAVATIGVYCRKDNPNNFGAYVPKHLPQTNQTAELLAFLKAVQIGGSVNMSLKKPGLVIASDSEYVCSGVTLWRKKWKANGYYDIHNADLFWEIARQISHL